MGYIKKPVSDTKKQLGVRISVELVDDLDKLKADVAATGHVLDVAELVEDALAAGISKARKELQTLQTPAKPTAKIKGA